MTAAGPAAPVAGTGGGGTRDADAIVIGAGPNGLVAANVLADAGWRVLVLEAEAEPGGAVRSDEGVEPGFVSDLFSSFYPLAAASPALRALQLERHGLRWSHAPSVLAHPRDGGRAAVLHREPERTAEALERSAPGDGEAYLRLLGLWDQVSGPLLDALLGPFPPVRAGARLARAVHGAGGTRLLRLLTLPARRLGQEWFRGPGAPLLLTGCGLHADFLPESPGSGAFGWLLVMLGQRLGWPVPEGGASALTGALVRRLAARGGVVRCGEPVAGVVVARGRCVGVRTAGGETLRAGRAVLADVPAPALYGGLVPEEELPARLRADIRRFQWDFATFKTDWALDGPIPWAAPEAAGAGTVHVAGGLSHLSHATLDVITGVLPERPCLVLGQMTTADPSRSPEGTESAWAYTHVPQHPRDGADWDPRRREELAARVEAAVEHYAPGFRAAVRARRVLAPPDLQARNRSLVGGSLNGGTAAPHQQLIFRPVPGTGRPATPIPGLFLASSSAHPGGGVHGACGANAARAALRSAWRPVRRRRSPTRTPQEHS